MTAVEIDTPERADTARQPSAGNSLPDQDDAPPSGGDRPSLVAQFAALYLAGGGLLTALRRVFAALGALAGAEARVLRAGIPLFFIGTIALVAFSVSLWACVVALLFWLLRGATHSAGIALSVLVVGHLVLVGGLWFAIKRGMRQASFPQARAEWRAMRHQLGEDFAQFAHAHRPGEESSEKSKTDASGNEPESPS